MTPGLLLAILFLDLVLGDPHGWPHPIIWIGRLIEKSEGYLRKTQLQEKVSGVVLVIIVITCVAIFTELALQLATGVASWLGWLFTLWAGWSCLALRSLHRESRLVIADLERGELAAARQSLAMIVGRETANLDEEGILKATLETVAENTSDGKPVLIHCCRLQVLALLLCNRELQTTDGIGMNAKGPRRNLQAAKLQ